MNLDTVNSLEELLRLQSTLQKSSNQKTKIQFKCEVCDVLVTRRLFHKNKELLCRNCKYEKTNLERYGVANASSLQSVKEKRKETIESRFGVSNPMQSKEVVETLKQNNLKKLGVSNPMQIPEIAQKCIDSRIENFDRDAFREKVKLNWSLLSSEERKRIEEKRKNTCEEKYGDPCFNNREKFSKTNLERFGVSNPMQNLEILKKNNSKYEFDNLQFDSSWELSFYIYHKDMGSDIKREPIGLEYSFNGKAHLLFPDFSVGGKLIEIKGPHLLKAMKGGFLYSEKDSELQRIKYKCFQDNNVEILTKEDLKFVFDYLDSKYGRKFCDQFRK